VFILRDSLLTVCAGFVQVIKGEGMPEFERSTRGDLFIEYNVVLPTEISPQLRRSEWLLTSLFTQPLLTSLSFVELMEAFHNFNGHDEL
jgi:DnaJ-class molecular chaperone